MIGFTEAVLKNGTGMAVLDQKLIPNLAVSSRNGSKKMPKVGVGEMKNIMEKLKTTIGMAISIVSFQCRGQSCFILNYIGGISSIFINEFVQKCQYYYTLSDQSVPLVTVRSVFSLLTK